MSVSVVTPNYNNAPYVKQYLESLLTDEAVSEIVVYDNGSTDGSPELLEALGQPKIRVIRGGRNLGATLGRHEAVMASTNEFICFLDGDDFLGPNAVQTALDTLRSQELDIALFQCFDVDLEGRDPVVTVPAPEQPIDGRTAVEMTMGGWRIHIWGVIRKSVYERAWENFQVHGYLSDEVLTRRLFLMANRVGGTEGEMFYRRVPKTRDAQNFIDWGRTTVRSLALGIDAKLGEDVLRQQRRMTVRFLFGLARRAIAGKMPGPAVGELLDEYFSVKARWKLTDAPWMAVDRLLRVMRPMLR